jgi:hypothetical protein
MTEGLDEPQKAAVLVGPVYFVLYVLSALASRQAHRLVGACSGGADGNTLRARAQQEGPEAGRPDDRDQSDDTRNVSPKCLGEDRTARLLWAGGFVAFAAMVPAAYWDVHAALITGFVLLYVLQNLWRPVLVSRFDARGTEEQGATLLSLESQAKSVSTMIVAPLLGYAVDTVKAHGLGGDFWPVAALGAFVSLGFFLTARRAEEA